jgi:TatD DNase family protein
VWFDSHCHLHLCDHAPIVEVLRSALVAGVDRILTIGIDGPSTRASQRIASDNGLLFSAGVHPNQADEWDDSREEIESALGHERCVAVGETGLDFYREGAPREVQERAFSDQIALAKAHDKALVIHTRESVAAALDILESVGPPSRLVFHCWSGSADELSGALDAGAHVSFAGNVSFPSAGDLRDAAEAVPADRLLVETDSPFLAPVPRRGRPNEPANVVHVGAAVAEARGELPENVAAATARNAANLFGV